MSLHFPRPPRTPKQTYQRILESSRRSTRRKAIIVKRALIWINRNRPDVMDKIYKQAFREIPNPGGRKCKLRSL